MRRSREIPPVRCDLLQCITAIPTYTVYRRSLVLGIDDHLTMTALISVLLYNGYNGQIIIETANKHTGSQVRLLLTSSARVMHVARFLSSLCVST